MRLLTIFLAGLLFASTATQTFAGGATVGIDGKHSCPNGIHAMPKAQSQLFTDQTPIKVTQAYFNDLQYCVSACFDEDIVIAFSGSPEGFVVTPNGKSVCKDSAGNRLEGDAASQTQAVQNNRGCFARATNPRAAVHIPKPSGVASLAGGNINITVSRCLGEYANDYLAQTNSYGKVIGVLNTAADDVIPKYKGQTDNSAPVITGDPSHDALTKALTDAKVSPIEAVTVATNASDDVIQKYLQNKDTQSLQDVVTNAKENGASIDVDQLKGKIASLDPEKIKQDATPQPAPDTTQVGDGSKTGSTFDGQKDVQPSTLADSVSWLCNEPSMNGCGNACSYNPNRLTCWTNNPGALTYSSWESKYGGQPCGATNNTTCFPNVEAGVAAQLHLLTTSSRYFASGNGTLLSAFCGGYAEANCQPYVNFIANQTGISPTQTIDPNNSELMAKIMMASSRFENGNGVIYTPQQLEKGFSIFYNGESIPTGTPGYTARSIYGTGRDQRLSSVFDPYGTPVSMNGIDSAFSYTTPVNVRYPVNIASNGGGSTNYQSGYYGSSFQNITQPTQTAKPTLSIIASPTSVQRGGSVVVSWSTANVSNNSLCRIFQDNATLLSNSNGGAKQVVIATSTNTGSTSFTMQCTGLDNNVYTKSASVTVQ